MGKFERTAYFSGRSVAGVRYTFDHGYYPDGQAKDDVEFLLGEIERRDKMLERFYKPEIDRLQAALIRELSA